MRQWYHELKQLTNGTKIRMNRSKWFIHDLGILTSPTSLIRWWFLSHIGIHNPYVSIANILKFILKKFRQHFPIVLQVHKMDKAQYVTLSKYAPREQEERLPNFIKIELRTSN